MKWSSALATVVVACAFASPASAQVVNELNFQGKLTDASGNPITAATGITFRVFNVATGGTALWTEARTGGNAVTPNANGVYSVRLGSVTAFPGTLTFSQALWLELQVGADAPMTPRYQMTSAPYSLRSARIGALTDAGLTTATSVTDANLTTLTAGSSSNADTLHTHAVFAATSHSHTLAGDVTGSESATTVGGLRGISVAATAPTSAGDVLRYNGTAWAPSAGGSGSNVNADVLDGLDSAAFMQLAAGQTNTGAKTFADATLLLRNAGGTASATFGASGITAARTVNLPDASGTVITTGNLTGITTVGTIGAGTWQGSVIAPAYGGTGLNTSATATGALLFTSAAGVWSTLAAGANGDLLTLAGGVPSWASATAHSHFGASWTGTGTGTSGLSVTNSATTGVSTGLRGETASSAGYGVWGNNTATTGISPGVYGTSSSSSGRSIFGVTSTGTGVWGESSGAGGVGVYGLSAGSGYGVVGQTNSSTLYGVWGSNTSGTAGSIGVYGSTSSGTGYGVQGTASGSGRGVFGQATATSGVAYGVYGSSASASGYGVYGINSDTNGVGVYGQGGSNGNGVQGVSTNVSGVYGSSSTSFGIEGFSSGWMGVAGTTNTSVGGAAGVWGRNLATTGTPLGVFGSTPNSSAGTGVQGDTVAGRGIFGNATGAGTGVYASSSSGFGTEITTATGSIGAFVTKTGLTSSGAFGYGARISNTGGSTVTNYGLSVETTRPAAVGPMYGISSDLGGTSSDPDNVWGVHSVVRSGITGATVHGLASYIEGSTNTNTVYGVISQIGIGAMGLRAAPAYGIYNTVALDAGRTGGGACYGYYGNVSYSPGLGNATSIYGVYQELPGLGGTLTGPNFAGVFFNSASSGSTTEIGVYGSVGLTNTPGVAAGVYGYAALPGAFGVRGSTNNATGRGGYFENTSATAGAVALEVAGGDVEMNGTLLRHPAFGLNLCCASFQGAQTATGSGGTVATNDGECALTTSITGGSFTDICSNQFIGIGGPFNVAGTFMSAFFVINFASVNNNYYILAGGWAQLTGALQQGIGFRVVAVAGNPTLQGVVIVGGVQTATGSLATVSSGTKYRVLAMVRSSSSIDFYVNNVLAGSLTGVTLPSSATITSAYECRAENLPAGTNSTILRVRHLTVGFPAN
ncbi:MAG: hypothetical protein L0216_05460 [Planctomycetales bacterium]|nr:hypothetical protein [Planctomycetales bacterium]